MGRRLALGISALFLMAAVSAGLFAATSLFIHGILHPRTLSAFGALLFFLFHGLAAYRWWWGNRLPDE